MGQRSGSSDPDDGFGLSGYNGGYGGLSKTTAAAKGLVVKQGHTNLYGFSGRAAVAGWWLIVDANALPANGDVTPVLLDAFEYGGPGGPYAISFDDVALHGANGIAILFSTTGPYLFTQEVTPTAFISAKAK